MFKKFSVSDDVSAQTAIKSSAVRAAKKSISDQFPSIEPYLDEILPKKGELLEGKGSVGAFLLLFSPAFGLPSGIDTLFGAFFFLATSLPTARSAQRSLSSTASRCSTSRAMGPTCRHSGSYTSVRRRTGHAYLSLPGQARMGCLRDPQCCHFFWDALSSQTR